MAETNVGEGRRVAVVGAGPTGFYASDQLLGMGFSVDLYDRLPTPFGLVRFGVAPDHPKIKSVTRMYEKTARKDGFRFFGGVAVGEDITCAPSSTPPKKRKPGWFAVFSYTRVTLLIFG